MSSKCLSPNILSSGSMICSYDEFLAALYVIACLVQSIRYS